VVQPLANLVVRPVGVDGVAVDGSLLAARITATGTLLDLPRQNVEQRADGSWGLRDLHRGEHALLFLPTAGGFAIGGPLRCRVDGAATSSEVRLVVPPASFLPLLVVRSDGSPVASSVAELLVSATGKPLQPEGAAPFLRGRRADVLRGQHQFVVGQGRTDAGGRVRLQAPSGSFLLRLTGADHRVHTREVVVGASLLPQTIAVESAASLRGQLGPPAALAILMPAAAEGRQLRVSAQLPKPATAVTADVAADGTFLLGPLPTGSCALVLHCWLRLNGETAQLVPIPLGAIAADGAPIEQAFDLGALLPTRVHSSLVWNDAPLANSNFFVRRRGASRDLNVRARTDAAGRCDLLLPPGDYDCQYALPSEPGPGYLMLPVPSRLEVKGTEPLAWSIAAHRRELRVTLFDKDGTLLAQRRVRLEPVDGWFRPGVLVTDDAGLLVLAPAPYGPFSLLIDVEPGDVWRAGPLEIPEGSRELVQELRR
jgi:hypothetical protein